MNLIKNKLIYLILLLAVALFLRYFLITFIGEENSTWMRIIVSISILVIGAVYILRGTAKIIEETTEVLSQRTKIAGGVLQSLGTAFPDMVLGIVAAIISLRLISTDYTMAINYAIIAAATTFGSNIYNIGHAAWCIFRQNLANKINKAILMFPRYKKSGTVTPFQSHEIKPSLIEIDTSIEILNALTILTAIVALSMVIFGRLETSPEGMSGDIYQLIRPVGFVIFFLGAFIIYYFRKTKRAENLDKEIIEEEKYYKSKSTIIILINLLIAGLAILWAAESMVKSIEVICNITGLPFVIAGVLAGIIGCLGEMIVIHNFTVNPKGRIGDAIVGVSMDNIVTTMGAAIVAIMGGIFLGGSSLILIFVIILTLNTILIWQISKLKNFFLKKE